jgi:hypothetical protein
MSGVGECGRLMRRVREIGEKGVGEKVEKWY